MDKEDVVHTVEYYSAMKRNGIESFVELWVDLEPAPQRSERQRRVNKCVSSSNSDLSYIFSLCLHTGICMHQLYPVLENELETNRHTRGAHPHTRRAHFTHVKQVTRLDVNERLM